MTGSGKPVALRDKILDLYREVDAAVRAAGPVCVASGRCCRFKEYGHVLFLSSLEADVLLAGAPPYEQPVSPDFCPFQQDNLCTAREPRPLGCRVYFCDPNYQETGNRITETFLARLKALAEEHGLPWQYAPLHRFLRESGGKGDCPPEERGQSPFPPDSLNDAPAPPTPPAAPPDQRTALPVVAGR